MQSTSWFEPADVVPPAAWLARFDRPVPHNLALPPAAVFSAAFSGVELAEVLSRRRSLDGAAHGMPLHLLVRLPWRACPEGDRMCGALSREIRGIAEALGSSRDVARVTFLACSGLGLGDRNVGALVEALAARFRMPAVELCVDVASADLPTVRDWRVAGVSRLVLHGPPPDALVVARASAFMRVTAGVACDRPGQSTEALAASLRELVEAGAARIDLGAHGSVAMPIERPCRDASGPASSHLRRSARRAVAIDLLLRTGFRHLVSGLFVREDDPLVRARRRGRLHLEVDGLAAMPAGGTLAIGPDVPGRIGAACYRNASGPGAYLDAAGRHGLCAASGVILSREAQARRAAADSLVCNASVDFEAIATSHLVDASRCFAHALRTLAPMARAGLVEIDGGGIELTPQGRHVVEVVAAAFDVERA